MKKHQPSILVSSQVSSQLDNTKDKSLTLSEALQVLRHLTDRKLLCTKCGYGLATLENQYNIHCEACKTDAQSYSSIKRGTVLDSILCRSLQDWVQTTIENNK